MTDWCLDLDYANSAYDAYPYPYYQEKEMQDAPAQCLPLQAQPYPCPSPALTVLPSSAQQGTQQPCDYNPTPPGETPRELRNKAEKQRRDKMNESVARLASIVPTVVKSGRKINKRSVLRLAAHYLRSHQHGAYNMSKLKFMNTLEKHLELASGTALFLNKRVDLALLTIIVFGNSIDRGPEFSAGFTTALLKNLKGFLITTTYKGLIVVVSPNIQEYLGYTELELLGQNVFSIIHKDDHQLLAEQLFPKSCALSSNGQLLIPKENGAEKKVAKDLANEKRSFIIRFKKLNHQRTEPAQYVTCHVEGSLRKSDAAGVTGDQEIQIRRRLRSRRQNPFSSGNDIVFVGMVRPNVDTFLSERGLESFKMEYRTRHSIDGEIIQCEQRIALVTGYMTHEVKGVNAMNFIHRDDVRWVIIALREMYDQHRLFGESCYRLMTKNGKFIYMRTLGRLDVDEDTKVVTSFVCTNTVVQEEEGKHLINLMKRKFTLMVNNGEPRDFDDDNTQDNLKKSLQVEDPRQLEKVILHLVTNLPSPQPEDSYHNTYPNSEPSPSHLAIIPPQREQIQKAIEKSYSVIKYLDMAANRELNNTSSFRNQRSTITPRSVARPQYNPPPQSQPPLLPLPEEEDPTIMDALCLGTCRGPPCTCLVGELATSSISISPTEADLYLSLFSEAATATESYNGLFAEAATATSSDTATMPYIINKPIDVNKTSFNLTSDEVRESQPKRNSSELINRTLNKKEICFVPTSIQTPKNERPFIRPLKIYDVVPEPSSVKRQRETEDNINQDPDWSFMLNMAIKDSNNLECGRIDSSNTMLNTQDNVKDDLLEEKTDFNIDDLLYNLGPCDNILENYRNY